MHEVQASDVIPTSSSTMFETASLNEKTVHFEAPNESGEGSGSGLERPLQVDNDSSGDQGAAPVSENSKSPSIHAAATSLNEESKHPVAVKGKPDKTIEDLVDLFREFLEAAADPATSNSTHTQRNKAGRKKKRGVFGLTKSSQPDTGSNNRYDYEQKYPQDLFGEETTDKARVWFTYLDEAETSDREEVDGWKERADILLVFAGLFSGVITTFVSQASPSLQKDNTQVSASLLFEIAQLLRAQSSGTTISHVPNSTLTPTSPFIPSTNAFLVNSLLFTSLAITLSTALFAVLAKQWLYHYLSPVRGTANERVRVRQLRYKGFELWKVGTIVDLLPILLYLAVAVFLTGIIVLLFPLDIRIAWTIVAISGITYGLYLISTILPILYLECPYTTSLTIYVGILLLFLRTMICRIGKTSEKVFQAVWRRINFNARHTIRRLLHDAQLRFINALLYTLRFILRGFRELRETIVLFPEDLPNFTEWREESIKKAVQDATFLDYEALDWLYGISPNRSLHRIIARCVAVHPIIGRRFNERGICYNLSRTLEVSEANLVDLPYGLCLDLLSNDTQHWRLLRSIPDADECQLEEAEYRSYSRIAENVITKDCYIILKDAIKDNLKFPLAMWCFFFEEASRDATIAAHILLPVQRGLFQYWKDPTRKPIYNAGVISLDSGELGWWKFEYLYRYFGHHGGSPDYSSEAKSFEIRYLLFVSVYGNLTSDQPLIADIEQRQKSLSDLFINFRFWLDTQPRVSSEQFLAFFINIFCADAFWSEDMTDWGKEAAVRCLDQIWDSMDTDVANQFPFMECDDLSLIYHRWCSRDDLGSFLPWYTIPIFLLLLAPRNRKRLCDVLLNDSDAVSHFSTCLRNFEYRTFNTTGPNLNQSLMDLLKSVDTKGPLFNILYNSSVLLQLWRFLSLHELNGKTFLSILNPKLYPPQKLYELHDSMKSEAQSEPSTSYRPVLEASAREFGQSIDVAHPQLQSSVEHQSTGEKNHDSEERAQPEEPNGNEHENNSMVHRMKKVFQSLWLKMTVE